MYLVLYVQSSSRVLEVYQYLCLVAPFGSPVETSPANLKLYLQSRKTGAATPKQKARAVTDMRKKLCNAKCTNPKENSEL